MNPLSVLATSVTQSGLEAISHAHGAVTMTSWVFLSLYVVLTVSGLTVRGLVDESPFCIISIVSVLVDLSA